MASGLVVWGGGSARPAREGHLRGATVVSWPGAPAHRLERAGVPFRTFAEALGPDALAAAEAAARTWSRVWGLLPLLDGRSFRDLVCWRGSSLLWCASEFLREKTAGPRCARTAEIALRLLETTGATEVDAHGLAPADALILARASTARGVLFHGRRPASGRPLPVARPAPGRGLRRAIAAALAPKRAPPGCAAGCASPVVAFLATGEEKGALAPLLGAVSDELERGVVPVTLADLRRWETRRVLRAAAAAGAFLRERLTQLRGTPGLAASYAHRGIGFADLATRDLEAVLTAHLPESVRTLEAAVELLGAASPSLALVVVPGQDEERALLHACAAAGVDAVVVPRGATGDVRRQDGGPQPYAVLAWEPGTDPGPAAARLVGASRGRVGVE